MVINAKDYKKIVKATDKQIAMLSKAGGFSKRDQICFRAARDAAMFSDFSRAKLGCVIYYKGSIIGSGCNSQKTDPIQMKYNSYREFNNPEQYSPHKHGIHAEIAAIKSVKKSNEVKWSKAKLYVFRVGANLNNCQGLAKPCPACSHFIQDKGIKTIFYTDAEGFTKAVVLDD